jgi:uncharacterized membrane protein
MQQNQRISLTPSTPLSHSAVWVIGQCCGEAGWTDVMYTTVYKRLGSGSLGRCRCPSDFQTTLPTTCRVIVRQQNQRISLTPSTPLSHSAVWVIGQCCGEAGWPCKSASLYLHMYAMMYTTVYKRLGSGSLGRCRCPSDFQTSLTPSTPLSHSAVWVIGQCCGEAGWTDVICEATKTMCTVCLWNLLVSVDL